MTEYDFSPEAYERYIHTQQRIATWVDQTEEHRPEFGTAIGTPSSHQGTPPMLHPMPLYERGNHSTYERRRPSFSSSSDSSSSSSTGSSDYLPKASAPMPAQPMYLQHAVANPLHSNRPHHSNPQRHHYGRQSSHVRSVPRSFSRGAAAPTIYGHNNGHVLTAQLKGMSLVASPQSPYYQPTPTGKSGYSFQQTIYPQTVPAGGAFHPPLRSRPPLQSIYSAPVVIRSSSNPQHAAVPERPYPGPPTVYPLTTYGPRQSTMQPPVFYQRVYRNGSTRRKGSGRRSHSRRSQ